jgi:putative transposase
MQISRSSYYKHLKGTISQKKEQRVTLQAQIKTIYKWSSKRYGSPKIHKELLSQGVKVSRPLVAKLMKQAGLRSIAKKKYKITTDSKHHYPVMPNLLDRKFSADKKNTRWVSDITYIKTKEGFLYLTVVLDLFDRKVVGWAMSENLKAQDTTIAALKIALNEQSITKKHKLLFHSDRGSQYACKEFARLAKSYDLQRSMSGKGNCYDNAVAESFFKSIKVEMIYHNKFENRQDAQVAIFEYIHTFYNTKRRHQYLNYLNINEFHQLKNVS